MLSAPQQSHRLLGDAPGSLRCRRLPTRCPGKRRGLCSRLPAALTSSRDVAAEPLPGGKAALPGRDKGLAPAGGDPRWCGGCRSPVRAAGMRRQSGLSCPSASLASGGSPGRRARRWILRPAAPPREGHACGGHSQPQPGPVNSPRATASRSQSHQARESSPMDGESRAALAASLTYAEPRPEPQLSRSLGINHPE